MLQFRPDDVAPRLCSRLREPRPRVFRLFRHCTFVRSAVPSRSSGSVEFLAASVFPRSFRSGPSHIAVPGPLYPPVGSPCPERVRCQNIPLDYAGDGPVLSGEEIVAGERVSAGWRRLEGQRWRTIRIILSGYQTTDSSLERDNRPGTGLSHGTWGSRSVNETGGAPEESLSRRAADSDLVSDRSTGLDTCVAICTDHPSDYVISLPPTFGIDCREGDVRNSIKSRLSLRLKMSVRSG